MGVLIALFFSWPFVHQQLVLRYRVNPWKLAGWAMYTTVRPIIHVRLVGMSLPDERSELDRRATPELAVAVRHYVWRRRTLGLFADPLPVVQRLAEAYPEHARWILIVHELGLTERSWIGLNHRSMYVYGRASGGLEKVGVWFSVPTTQPPATRSPTPGTGRHEVPRD